MNAVDAAKDYIENRIAQIKKVVVPAKWTSKVNTIASQVRINKHCEVYYRQEALGENVDPSELFTLLRSLGYRVEVDNKYAYVSIDPDIFGFVASSLKMA